ncbi:MAG TPA: response regulator, partial [Calditrichia bacterium]|nr:response regulator [Calditrichia bacterium]
MSKRILIVDDDRGILSTMSEFLQREGYQILQATNGREALHQLREERPDILLSDVSMPEIDGMELLEQAHTKYPSMPIMLITGFGSISLAVEAMKKGAQDFVIKPLRFDELLAKVRTMSELCDLKRENASLRKELNSQYSFENIIGQSPKLIKIFEMLKQVSPTDTSILIRGEAGTGKELIAKAIHSL